MSLKLQIYTVKGALQHLLNMVDKPAQLLDNAVMKGLNFLSFLYGQHGAYSFSQKTTCTVLQPSEIPTTLCFT